MNLLLILGKRRTPLTPCALVVLAALSAGQALGQAPTAALLRPEGLGAAVDLGTLILSPAQRRRLESARNAPGGIEGAGQPVADGQNQEPLTGLPTSLAVSGFVIRSDKRSTVWINEQPLYGRTAPNALRTLAGESGVLQQGAGDIRARARPGQVIDVPSGQAVDLLPPGAIRIIPPKAGKPPVTKD